MDNYTVDVLRCRTYSHYIATSSITIFLGLSIPLMHAGHRSTTRGYGCVRWDIWYSRLIIYLTGFQGFVLVGIPVYYLTQMSSGTHQGGFLCKHLCRSFHEDVLTGVLVSSDIHRLFCPRTREVCTRVWLASSRNGRRRFSRNGPVSCACTIIYTTRHTIRHYLHTHSPYCFDLSHLYSGSIAR